MTPRHDSHGLSQGSGIPFFFPPTNDGLSPFPLERKVLNFESPPGSIILFFFCRAQHTPFQCQDLFFFFPPLFRNPVRLSLSDCLTRFVDVFPFSFIFFPFVKTVLGGTFFFNFFSIIFVIPETA